MNGVGRWWWEMWGSGHDVVSIIVAIYDCHFFFGPNQNLKDNIPECSSLGTPRLITAISDFTIMYTTQLWVFTGGLTRHGGHAPCCSLLRGYFTCLRILVYLGQFVTVALYVAVEDGYASRCMMWWHVPQTFSQFKLTFDRRCCKQFCASRTEICPGYSCKSSVAHGPTLFKIPYAWPNRCTNNNPGYHFGTMVLGSLVVGIAQPFRISMGALAGVVRLESNSTGILNCFCSWIGDVYATWTRTRTRSFDIFYPVHGF